MIGLPDGVSFSAACGTSSDTPSVSDNHPMANSPVKNRTLRAQSKIGQASGKSIRFTHYYSNANDNIPSCIPRQHSSRRPWRENSDGPAE